MSDDEIYSQYRSGHICAFDQLISKYSARLVLYLDGFLHDTTEAEDVAIEVFASIMLKKPTIQPGHFQTYLFKTARNRAIRFHRRRGRLFSFEDVQMEDLLAAYPEETFLLDERRMAVHRYLNRIDPEPREALWLIYFEDMSYAQAAAVMGVNTKRVDNLLGRGKRLMRSELSKEGITGADE